MFTGNDLSSPRFESGLEMDSKNVDSKVLYNKFIWSIVSYQIRICEKANLFFLLCNIRHLGRLF